MLAARLPVGEHGLRRTSLLSLDGASYDGGSSAVQRGTQRRRNCKCPPRRDISRQTEPPRLRLISMGMTRVEAIGNPNETIESCVGTTVSLHGLSFSRCFHNT